MVDHEQLVGILFREQSIKWKDIAQKHLELIVNNVGDHLAAVALHVAGCQTAELQQLHWIQERLESRGRQLMGKLDELVLPYREYHPITFSTGYVASETVDFVAHFERQA